MEHQFDCYLSSESYFSFSLRDKSSDTRVRPHSCVASLEHVTTVFNIHEHSHHVMMLTALTNVGYNFTAMLALLIVLIIVLNILLH